MYIDQLKVTNVGCVRDLQARLSPLHAFIGPNDSGKSTLLRAIQSVFVRVRSGRKSAFLRPFLAADGGDHHVELSLAPASHLAHCHSDGDGTSLRIHAQGQDWSDWDSAFKEATIPASGETRRLSDWLRRGDRFVRWEADALRNRSSLIPDHSNAKVLDERGRGLAGVYDLIFNRGDDARDELQAEFRRLFPTVRGLRLRNVSDKEKELEVLLASGDVVPANTMSEGMLYYLAFAAIRYLDPPAVLLVEEPENGLHPARIADVVRILREISKTTQVVMATHSPLVVNELEPGEVTVITRDAKAGTQAHALQETHNFEERHKVYALGELWLSYANGEDEAPLLNPGGDES